LKLTDNRFTFLVILYRPCEAHRSPRVFTPGISSTPLKHEWKEIFKKRKNKQEKAEVNCGMLKQIQTSHAGYL